MFQIKGDQRDMTTKCYRLSYIEFCAGGENMLKNDITGSIHKIVYWMED